MNGDQNFAAILDFTQIHGKRVETFDDEHIEYSYVNTLKLFVSIFFSPKEGKYIYFQLKIACFVVLTAPDVSKMFLR